MHKRGDLAVPRDHATTHDQVRSSAQVTLPPLTRRRHHQRPCAHLAQDGRLSVQRRRQGLRRVTLRGQARASWSPRATRSARCRPLGRLVLTHRGCFSDLCTLHQRDRKQGRSSPPSTWSDEASGDPSATSATFDNELDMAGLSKDPRVERVNSAAVSKCCFVTGTPVHRAVKGGLLNPSSTRPVRRASWNVELVHHQRSRRSALHKPDLYKPCYYGARPKHSTRGCRPGCTRRAGLEC